MTWTKLNWVPRTTDWPILAEDENAIRDNTVDMYDSLTAEHTEQGEHNSPVVARIVAKVIYTDIAGLYAVVQDQDGAGRRLRVEQRLALRDEALKSGGVSLFIDPPFPNNEYAVMATPIATEPRRISCYRLNDGKLLVRIWDWDTSDPIDGSFFIAVWGRS